MVNNAPLIVFRVLFGLLMVAESFGAIATGWVHKTYVAPQMTFPILPMGWPRPLPGYGMYGWFVVMGLAAAATMVGWRYRWSSFVLAVMWTGAYLTQKTNYNNHYYLAVLICWVLVLLPAHRRGAFDAGRRVAWTDRCPAWIGWAFRFQLAVVFTYAAIAKLYPGWIDGDYIGVVFGWRSSRPVIGPLLAQPWFQTFITYSGIAFDAFVIPMLWWSRTRWLAFFGLILFNVFNSVVFLIGVFPYMVLALTVFFFDPDAVERRFRALFRGDAHARASSNAAYETTSPSAGWRPVHTVLAIYFAVQIALPLRHHLIEGDVNWTSEGHRLSWRMMVHTKSGQLRLRARTPDGRSWVIDQSKWLTRKQRRRIATRPDMLYQFIQVLKAHYHREGTRAVQIYAEASAVSLNGAPPAPLYDPAVDLAQAGYHPFSHSPWVLLRPH